MSDEGVLSRSGISDDPDVLDVCSMSELNRLRDEGGTSDSSSKLKEPEEVCGREWKGDEKVHRNSIAIAILYCNLDLGRRPFLKSQP